MYLPMVKFIPVKFHMEPFYNSDGSKNNTRFRSSKMEYFKNYTGIQDLSKVYFIDDTESIISEAKELGVEYTYYKNDSTTTVDLLTKVSFDAIGIIDNKTK